jgi:septal ring factor EnvC (AmiA/AmiB activator)
MINTGGKQQVKIEQLQQRIAELEGQIKDQCNIEMDMAKEIGEFYQKINRLDTALARIEDKGGRWSKEVARKARAGDE